MVMPRSRSRSIESSSCARMERGSTVCVSSRMRSASVDFPWSMWAMIEKFRMCCWSAMFVVSRLRGTANPARDELHDLARLRDAHGQHAERVDRGAGEQAAADRDQLGDPRAAQRLVEAVPDEV